MHEIPGYENLYSITEEGQVWSHKYKRWMKNQVDRAGYWAIQLYKDKEYKRFLVHRLVAMTFIPNPNGLPQVNHINGNKLDNRIANLEWCTKSADSLHMHRMGFVKHLHNPRPWNKRPVDQYTPDGKFIKRYPGVVDAAKETGINRCTINNSKYGYCKTGGGYIWKAV